MDSWYEWGKWSSGTLAALTEAEEAKTVSFGIQLSPATTFKAFDFRSCGMACCLFSLPYTFK